MVHTVDILRGLKEKATTFFFIVKSGSFKQNIYSLTFTVTLSLLLGLLEGASYFAFLLGLAAIGGDVTANKFLFLERLHFGFFGWISIGILLQLVKSVCTTICTAVTAKMMARVQASLQVQVIAKITSMKYPEAARFRSGELVELAKYPNDHATQFLTHCYTLTINCVLCLGMILSMLFISWQLTCVISLGGGCILLGQRLLQRKLQCIILSMINDVNEIFSKLIEMIANIKILHLFNLRKHLLNQSDKSATQVAVGSSTVFYLSQVGPIISEFVSILSIGLSFVIGAKFLENYYANYLPLLITFGGIGYRFIGKLGIIAYSYLGASCAVIYIRKVYDFINKYEPSPPMSNTPVCSTLNKPIEISDLSFTYSKKAPPVLKDICLDIPIGKTSAIIGYSGSGKSTLINLITGLYSPTKGVIRVDEVSLQDLDITSWRNKIGVVNQENAVFNDTLKNNILLGKLDASEADFLYAVEMANVSQFAENFPQKYETVIGERGFKLSGGEKQRVALARALIRRPEILILDEATSHLDSISERAIQNSIQKLSGKMTIICIAHRLSTIITADNIVVLDKGSIAEQGTHEVLLQKRDHYFAFWQSQFSHVSPVSS